ncbi:MAG: dodecin [Dehalococcoidia bacterium]
MQERRPHTYDIMEVVGSSQQGIEDAIENAIGRASQTVRHLEWFEMREVRGMIADGKVGWYQVRLGIGFRLEDPS